MSEIKFRTHTEAQAAAAEKTKDFALNYSKHYPNSFFSYFPPESGFDLL
jgi:hypothetical protein